MAANTPEATSIALFLSVWADQRDHQGDKLVISQLITTIILSPCPETLKCSYVFDVAITHV